MLIIIYVFTVGAHALVSLRAVGLCTPAGLFWLVFHPSPVAFNIFLTQKKNMVKAFDELCMNRFSYQDASLEYRVWKQQLNVWWTTFKWQLLAEKL